MKQLGFLIFILSLSAWSQAQTTFPVADHVSAEFIAVYSEWNTAPGKSLKIIYDLANDSVAAQAKGNASSVEVTLFGGLLNSQRVTADGLRMLICHEIGHNLGGSPRKDNPLEWDGESASDGRSMLSSEGQADYYASAVCFPRLIANTDHRKLIDESKITPRLQELCIHGQATPEKQGICLRSALAAKNMLEAVADFPISFETPDLEPSPRLLRNEYPSRQCRLDTMVAGALCTQALPLQLDFLESNKNDCPSGALAQRPACWYKDIP